MGLPRLGGQHITYEIRILSKWYAERPPRMLNGHFPLRWQPLMAIEKKPIYLSELLSDSSLSVETSKASKGEDIIGYGWMSSAQVQPGFIAFAGHYQSHERYTISALQPRGLHIGFYLGDGYKSTFGGKDLHVPSGHFDLTSAEEPTPISLHRGENKQQNRCELWLAAEWIESASVERLDDTGAIRKLLATGSFHRSAAASASLKSAAERLFAESNWDGPLARLRREAAALALLAEALAEHEAPQIRSPTSTDAARMMRVKETLDTLSPETELSLVGLAVQHGMSVRSLSRHFRLTFGVTVLQYLSERRMEQARAAIERGGYTVDQAAYLAGFSHRTNFSLAFRRRYGLSPNKLLGTNISKRR
jgi:AraC-like DNA-binding protein